MPRTGLSTGTERPGGLLAAALVLATLMGCGHHPAKPAAPAPPPPFRWESHVGWLHGPCMAIADATLAPGTPVTLVLLDEPQSVVAAQIGERTTSGEGCWPLLEGRRTVNTQNGATFYRIVVPAKTRVRLAIGVLEPRAPVTVAAGAAEADLDADGQPETFTECSTTEGVRYGVWTGVPYRGVSRWSGYYFMDYDQAANCPPGAAP
jgi:hypothetical protein